MITPVNEEYLSMTLEDIATITKDEMLSTGGWVHCESVVEKLPLGKAVLCQAMGGISPEKLEASMKAGEVTKEEIDAVGGVEEYIKPFTYVAATVQYMSEEFFLVASATTKPGEEYNEIMSTFQTVVESIILK